jgi:hypothetical protein
LVSYKNLISKISEKNKTWFVITESLKNVKYALNNITYKIGDHEIFPAKLFTQDNSSSNCSFLTKTDKNSTCYLALTIDNSLPQIPVTYFVKGLGVSESTKFYLIPHQSSPLSLSIGLVFFSLLFIAAVFLSVFYAKHKRCPIRNARMDQGEKSGKLNNNLRLRKYYFYISFEIFGIFYKQTFFRRQ